MKRNRYLPMAALFGALTMLASVLLLAAEPKAAQQACEKGQVYLEKGDDDAAIAAFTEAIHLEPQYAEAYHSRGVAFGNEGEYVKALADLGEAIRLKPNEARTHYLMAGIHRRNGDPKMAGKVLMRAIELDPQGLRDFFWRAWICVGKRDIDKGIALCTERLHEAGKFPDSADYRCRGHLRYLNRDFDIAIADFTEALHHRPNRSWDCDCTLWFDRGCAHLENGKLESAISDLTEAIRINPGEMKPYVRRAWAFVEKGEIEKALADSAEALRLVPDSGEAHAIGGYALERKGDREQVRRHYAEAVRIEANNDHEEELRNLFACLSQPAWHDMPITLPVYSWLGSKQNRDSIDTSPEQAASLRQVAAEFPAEYQRWVMTYGQQLSHLPAGEQNAELAKAAGPHEEGQRKECCKRVEAILTSQQLDACKRFTLYSAARSVAFSVGRTEVDLIAQQREMFGKIRQEFSDQVERERKRWDEQLLTLLTARQRERLVAEIQRQDFRQTTIGSRPFGSSVRSSAPKVDPNSAFLYRLSFFGALYLPSVRKEAGLTANQQDQLAELNERMVSDQQELGRQLGENATEHERAVLTLQTAAGRRIEGLLTPKQLTALRDITLRVEGPLYLHDPFIREKIGLSASQNAAVQQCVREWNERVLRQSRKIDEKMFRLLTLQQQEKLREIVSDREWCENPRAATLNKSE